MQIRFLTKNDYFQWLTLWKEYLIFYQTELDDSVTDHTWHNLVKAEQIKGIGTFIEDNLVGFAHIVIHPNT